jgi:D-3-phosphoglycerate dehydrogenase
MVDEHAVDVPPAHDMLIVRNEDKPGVIGFVGSVLGAAGVNIDDMDVGRTADGDAALMVIATSDAVPEAVLDELRVSDLVRSVYAVSTG